MIGEGRMKITKELIEKLVGELVLYDQDTGISQVIVNYKGLEDLVLKEIKVRVASSPHHFEFLFVVYSDQSVEYGLVDSNGGEVLVYEPKLTLTEEPYSLPNLIRILIAKYAREKEIEVERQLKAVLDVVLYED